MTTAFAVDASCMIPAVSEWHRHHKAAAAEIERRLQRGERMIVPAHALAETYSVLTRLPAPVRLSVADAWAIVEANFIADRKVISLSGEMYVVELRDLASQGIAGGRTYDSLIAACAVEARASVLLTFNTRHFHPAPPGLMIVEPS